MKEPKKKFLPRMKNVEERLQEKCRRFVDSDFDEVREPDLWQLWHYGIMSTDPPESHRRFCDDHMEQMMRETNNFLERKRQRLEREYDDASEHNDLEATN